ncbi:MAG: chemotaxis protein CheW [Alphaproteobacteria bacterium]|nr:chemotaxis protein CheW [Altererythrobacter sp.]MBT8455850.1 chemotaxis protein CheW [Alphaproteobacteria bacterium]MBT8474743.1 chemotaxis protein CheW [Alphaproteobacteria bacterium]
MIPHFASILTTPSGIVPTAGSSDGIVGLFALDGASALLVDLSAQTNGTVPCDEAPYVLLVGCPGRQVGFTVRKVVGLSTSEWRSRTIGTDDIAEPLVQLGNGAEAEILPIVDLAGMAERLNAA